MNSIILCLHIALVCGLTLFALRCGIEMLIAWLSLLSVAMNLFVLKQITLFGLSVTSSDALAVGYLLGLNLIQEFFGRKFARKSMLISLFISCSFVFLSQIHLLYLPSIFDTMHTHFVALLCPVPRIIFASLFSFLLVQIFDLIFYNFLNKIAKGKYLTLRMLATLTLSQLLDTFLFSYLGLYGLVPSISHIIFLSLTIKGIVTLFSSPFVTLSKKVHRVSI